MAFNAGAILGTAKINDKSWNASIKGMAKGVGVLGAAIVGTAAAAMTKATIEANKWQKSMSNVNTVIDTTAISSQALAKDILTLDARLGDTKELTDAVYQSFSSGASSAEEALQITTDGAKFAKAAITDTATAVDVLTTAQNAYGKEVVNTSQASDVFFTTIKQGKINGEQLASTIGKSIPLFASLNIPLEELGSGMAAMTKQGVNAAESTTQLNGIINSFLKPSADMKAALEAQGHASGSALLETEGLTGALKFLDQASGGSKDELSKLLPSVEAVRGTLALTGKGGEEFTKILKEMGNASGATDKAFKQQEPTFETLNNQLGQIEILSGNIGKFFVDKIAVGAIQAGSAIVDFINSSRAMEIVAQVAEIAGAGFGVLESSLTIIKDNVLPPLSSLWKTVTETLSSFGGEADIAGGATAVLSTALQMSSMGFTIMAKTGEISIVTIRDLVKAVNASAKGVGSFFQLLTGRASWSEVKENFQGAGQAFKDLGGNAIGNVGDLIETTKQQFLGFTDGVQQNTIEIETSIKTSSDASRNYIISNWDEMLTGQITFVESYKENQGELEDETEKTNDELTDDAEETTGGLKSIWDNFFKDAEFSWKGLASSIQETFSFTFKSIGDLSSQFFTNEKAKLDNQNALEMEALTEKLNEEKEKKLEANSSALEALKLQNSLELITLKEKKANDLLTEEEFTLAKDELKKRETELAKKQQDELKAIDKQKEDLEKAQLARQNELAEKQFETQKGLNIAGVWLDAAKSIAGWWANAPMLGPIAGPIFAGSMSGAVTGMAIAQTALINQQQFVPARRMGGLAGGITRINEAGGEIVSLPDGSQVIPNDISRQIASNSGSNSVIINFNNPIVREEADMKRMARMVSKELSKQIRIA